MQKGKKIIIGCIIVLSIIYILVFMNIVLGQDEDFTMSIIRNSYSHILYLDSLDVHPPLYYLILKLFLNVTTFWTSSIFIKILFARIPSLIFAGITFIYLVRIFRFSGYKINIFYQYIAFLLIPTLMIYSTQIRMYSLTTMSLTIEFYELIKFFRCNKYHYLILALIFAESAAYSHYFGAVSAGLFLCIFSIKFINDHKIKLIISLLIIDILYLILYIPWMPVVIRQFKRASPTTVTNIYGVKKYLFLIKELIFSFTGAPHIPNHILSLLYLLPLFTFLVLIYLYMYKFLKYANRDFRDIFLIVFINFVLTIFFGEGLSVITHPFYNHRYVYPLFVIIMFLIFNLFIIMLNKTHVIYIIICILLLFNLVSGAYSVGNCIQSNLIIHLVSVYNKDPTKDIHVHVNNKSNGRITHMSVYLYSKKNIFVKKINSDNSFGRSEPLLFKQIYSNIKSKDIY